MDYLCLRNCVVNDRLWKEGKVYNLPVEMEKHPKNFRPMGEAPEPPPDAPQSTIEPVKSESNPLVCKECGKECKSEFGLKAHMRVHQIKEVVVSHSI